MVKMNKEKPDIVKVIQEYGNIALSHMLHTEKIPELTSEERKWAEDNLYLTVRIEVME
jgi:hypothetical protein